MWDRSTVKAKGKESFKLYYWQCVAVTFILSVITAFSSGGSGASRFSSHSQSTEQFTSQGTNYNVPPQLIIIIASMIGIVAIIAMVIKILVKNPMIVGGSSFFTKVGKREGAEFGALTDAFRGNYKNVVIAMFLRDLFIVLWSLLLVIPGIIKGLEYRMVPYLLAEDPNLSWKDAFAKSKEMMMGNKWAAFVLDLSFIGWYLLGIITCGLAFLFWTSPYKHATDAELYLTLKNQHM